MLSRLTRAVKYAEELLTLCQGTCDVLTCLEAEAYLLAMRGMLLSERGVEWDAAAGQLHRWGLGKLQGRASCFGLVLCVKEVVAGYGYRVLSSVFVLLFLHACM